MQLNLNKGHLTPPDTLSRPIGTFMCWVDETNTLTCWDQCFFRACRDFSTFLIQTSHGTFSIYFDSCIYYGDNEITFLQVQSEKTGVICYTVMHFYYWIY